MSKHIHDCGLPYCSGDGSEKPQPITFAALKERWCRASGYLPFGDAQMAANRCADELELLERAVRELRDSHLAKVKPLSLGNTAAAGCVKLFCDELTALLGDKAEKNS